MISYAQAVILGGLQGLTELFPVSSLGHSVILPTLFGWHIDQGADAFLIFLVTTHLATALVLLGFFFKDWVLIVKGIFRSLKDRNIDPADIYAKLGWLIVVATIPAGVLGILFQEQLQKLFAVPSYAAVFLFLNGLLLYGAEILKKKKAATITASDENIDSTIAKVSWAQSVKVGLAQCLALIPGFSRTGATLAGGLLIGLDHEGAARFSFLLATPIILAAAILKLPELLTPAASASFGPVAAGFIASAIAAYLSVRFLTRYFKTKTLTPFAIYCVLIGAVAFFLI